jgi:phospholipid transport system transporter-binding protein
MPAPAASEPAVIREGEALRFRGALVRAAVPALWRAARPLAAGARRIDISGVDHVDSAGLALLSAIADAAGHGIDVVGGPAGLDTLRAAYRLDGALGFAS